MSTWIRCQQSSAPLCIGSLTSSSFYLAAELVLHLLYQVVPLHSIYFHGRSRFEPDVGSAERNRHGAPGVDASSPTSTVAE